ncbi:RH13 [Acrasis kona]|uniref:ATP-dependent RNA helicase n=1 Tax=Acrasis kona TaxID=1008807 RepID=A0AAW2YIC6_9EUKA
MGKKKGGMNVIQNMKWKNIELTNEQHNTCEGLASFEVFDPTDASEYPVFLNSKIDFSNVDEEDETTNETESPSAPTDDKSDEVSSKKKKQKQKKKGKLLSKEATPAADMSQWTTFGLHATLLDNLQKLVLTHLMNTPNNEKKLLALIIAPTRELSVQVTDHIKGVTKDTGIHVINITGGMSEEKQKRQIASRPQIIVATPGRYWDLTNRGFTHLTELDSLQFLVIDEADRMIAEGHFSELRDIISYIKIKRRDYEAEGTKVPRIQNFVSSATLTLSDKWRELQESGSAPQPEPEQKKKRRRNQEDEDEEEEEKKPTGTVDTLLYMMEFSDYTIVDLTPKSQVAGTLEESQIQCVDEDKLLYLYLFLSIYNRGRTLIFTNSIKRVRLIQSVLSVLQVPITALHGEMQQRQRLNNLDRFKANEDGVLVATDVAARGLDIERVAHVVHYQLPNSVDAYVHRCGRSGRAGQPGFSLALVSPEDRRFYKDICSATGKEDGIELFPLDPDQESLYIPELRKRMKLAQKIEMKMRNKKQAMSEMNWFETAAKEADIDLDEHLKKQIKQGKKDVDKDRDLTRMQNELATMMKVNIGSRILLSRKYITSDLDRLSQVLDKTKKKDARAELVEKKVDKPKKIPLGPQKRPLKDAEDEDAEDKEEDQPKRKRRRRSNKK